MKTYSTDKLGSPMRCVDLAPARLAMCMVQFSRTSDAKVTGTNAIGLNLRIDSQTGLLFINLDVTW